jgi:hypothetical protein
MQRWKHCLLGILLVLLCVSTSSGNADSTRLPLVYSDSGGIWLRKSMVQSDLQKRRKCAGKVGVVTLRGYADYIFTVDQGLASVKWGWVVARQDGSVVASGSDLGVHHAVDDACVSIVKDWQEHKPDSDKQGTAPDR